MAYRIEGDGTWRGTKIWQDNVLLDGWKTCIIDVDEKSCMAYVDTYTGSIRPDTLDRVILLGVYKLIGDGDFKNTRLFINDEPLRGVQFIELSIKKDKDPLLEIKTIFLPNIVEGEGNE